jgi:hypothetical protein
VIDDVPVKGYVAKTFDQKPRTDQQQAVVVECDQWVLPEDVEAPIESPLKGLLENQFGQRCL